jgi:hypothetical protein
VKIARIISGLIYLIYLNSKWNIKYNLGFVAYEAEDFKDNNNNKFEIPLHNTPYPLRNRFTVYN